MTAAQSVNLSSLGIVSEELDQTLSIARDSWQAFDLDTDNTTQLKSVVQCLSQIHGAFRILELPGVAALSNDVLCLCKRLLDNPKKRSGTALAAVDQALAVMPRYLDFVRASGVMEAALLIPAQNEVRSFAGLPRITENAYDRQCVDAFTGQEYDKIGPDIDLVKLALTGRRLRQMYQTGLIGVLRDPQPIMGLGLMQRACERMYGLVRHHPIADRWWMATAVLEALTEQRLELTSSRRRWLSVVDKVFRTFLADVVGLIDMRPNAQDLNEMLYLISLAGSEGKYCSTVSQAFDLSKDLVPVELLAKQHRAYIYSSGAGVSDQDLDDINALLASAREAITVASESLEYDVESMKHAQQQLRAVENKLSFVELGKFGGPLEQGLASVETCLSSEQKLEQAEWMMIADALIMLERVVENSRGIIGTEQEMQDRINGSDLHAAELAVIREAQAGLNVAKRAITSYVEASYDPVHLGNVTVTLNSARGGLSLLGLERAADVLLRCTQFIDSTLTKKQLGIVEGSDEGNDKNNDESVLETLADALISLDYYLSQIEIRKDADDRVLDIADESLEAIGYPSSVVH